MNLEQPEQIKLTFEKPAVEDIADAEKVLLQWTEPEEARKYAERLKQEIDGASEFGMKFWVLKKDNTTIGVGGIADPLPSIRHYGTTVNPGELKILYLDNASRGLGAGARFLEFLEEQAKQEGRTEMLVRSAERYRKTAFEFYKNQGYEDLGSIINNAGQPMELFKKIYEN